MTQRQKWILGIAISLFSVGLIVVFGRVVRIVFEQFAELSRELNSF